MSEAAVFIALTADGAALARRLQPSLPGSRVLGLAQRVSDCDELFTDSMTTIATAFEAGHPVIGICASGILVRAVAGHLTDKRDEPPVIALSADGASVVPLVGGHRGGNRLAHEIAGLTGGHAAITTASDVAQDVSLDSPPAGWRSGDASKAKRLMANLLARETVTLSGHDGGWLHPLGLPQVDSGEADILISTGRETGKADSLVYYPPRLAVGVGCERDCEPEELCALVRRTLGDAGLSEQAVAVLVSVDLKENEAAVHAAAAMLGVPARFYTPARLEEETPRLANPSDVVFREVGCHGVAEGSALAAAGADGSLVVGKHKSARATCAIAESADDIDPLGCGRARGHLAVVGIGPGKGDWRTPEVSGLLRGAEEIVGYGFYLDLVDDLIQGKPRHQTDLGAEEARARHAIELAAEGRDVALVCSGDAGIYALATLVWELIDKGDDPAWQRIDVTVSPGVSALQAAAARAGAPIGHDFCAVSLSDLLTPKETVIRRVTAAAEGDFVTALYNPRSQRRTVLIEQTKEIFLANRPADTPVVIARSLGRPDEAVRIVTLAEFDPAEIDMMTILLIGSSRTRKLRHDGRDRAYTPRGYLD
jgi:cobalt-precorrin 5A hydrolase/precorrin-3B C17-methyltransferase